MLSDFRRKARATDIVKQGRDPVRLTCRNGITGGGMLMVLMLGVAYLRVKLELVT